MNVKIDMNEDVRIYLDGEFQTVKRADLWKYNPQKEPLTAKMKRIAGVIWNTKIE